MQKINQDYIFDIIKNKKGRDLKFPCFGDKLTYKEVCIPSRVKIAPKKKIIPLKKKEVTLKQFIKSNYNRTYIEVGRQTITLLRPLSVEGVKRLFPRAKSIYWENSKEEIFTDVLKLR